MFEISIRLLVALYLIAGGALIAYFIVGRLLPRQPVMLRFCGTVIAGMAISTAGFHALVPLRLFRLPVVVLTLLVLLAIVLGSARRRAILHSDIDHDMRWLRRVARRLRISPHGRYAVAFAICALPVVLRPLALPPLGWDLLTYHGPKAALWVQNGGPALVLPDVAGTWSYYRNIFAGGEVFYAWALLPMREELLPMLMQPVQWLCLGGCAMALSRELGAREPYGSTAAAFLLAVPTVRLLIGAGYVDVTVALCAVAGLALGAHLMTGAAAQKNARVSTGIALLCGTGLGLACGVKVFAIPAAATAIALLTIRLWSLSRKRSALVAIVACGLFALPWIGYNLVDKGRPLWPLHVRVAGIELGAPEATRRPERQLPTPYTVGAEIGAAYKTFALGAVDKEALGAPTLLPMLVLLGTAPWWLRRRRWQALFGVLPFVASAAIFYLPIFNEMRLGEPNGISRYWLVAVGAALPASVWWCEGGASIFYLGFLRLALFYQLLRFTTFGCSTYDLDIMALVAVALLFLYAAVRRIGFTARMFVIPCSIVVLLSYVVKQRDAQRYHALRRDYVLDGTNTYWLPMAQALDDPQQPRRIAVTAGPKPHADHWFTYPLFGRRLQNQVLHIATPDFIASDLHDSPAHVQWLQQLAAQNVTHVVSFHPSRHELAWMEQQPQYFRRLAGQNGRWGAFEIISLGGALHDRSPAHSPTP